ncbi:MAG: hypothetical protein HQ564_08455 [Candidatus Saganbacteria bacterium]|nr:hypothetical protein [Candidatus Saganbacteria bacterium]
MSRFFRFKIISFNAAEIAERESLSDVLKGLAGRRLTADASIQRAVQQLRRAGLAIAAPLVAKMVREGSISYFGGSQSRQSYAELIKDINIEAFLEEIKEMSSSAKKGRNLMQALEATEKLLILRELKPRNKEIKEALRWEVQFDLSSLFSDLYPELTLKILKRADEEGRLWKLFEILGEIGSLHDLIEDGAQTKSRRENYEFEGFLLQKLAETEYLGKFLEQTAQRIADRDSAYWHRTLLLHKNRKLLIDFAKRENNPNNLKSLVAIAVEARGLSKLIEEGDSSEFLDNIVKWIPSGRNNRSNVQQLIKELVEADKLKLLLQGITKKESFERLVNAARKEGEKYAPSDPLYCIDYLFRDAEAVGCLGRFVEVAEQEGFLEDLLRVQNKGILIGPAHRSGNLLNLLKAAEEKGSLGALIGDIKTKEDMALISALYQANKKEPVLIKAMAYVKIF